MTIIFIALKMLNFVLRKHMRNFTKFFIFTKKTAKSHTLLTTSLNVIQKCSSLSLHGME